MVFFPVAAGFLAVVVVFFPDVVVAGFLAVLADGFLAEEVDEAGFLAEDEAGFFAVEEAGFFAEDAGFFGFFLPEDVDSEESADTSRRPPRREPRPPDELPELLFDEEEESLPPPSKPPSRPPSPPDEPEEELPEEEDEPLPPPRSPPRRDPRPPDERFWELPELLEPLPSRPESMGPALPRTDVTVAREKPVFFDTFFSVSFSLAPPARSGRASPRMLMMSFFEVPVSLLTSFNCLLPICFKISDMSIVLLLCIQTRKLRLFLCI